MKLDERFNEKRSRLGENDLHIWQYISAHRQECAWLSIEALGAKCNVSRTTILRCRETTYLRIPGKGGYVGETLCKRDKSPGRP